MTTVIAVPRYSVVRKLLIYFYNAIQMVFPPVPNGNSRRENTSLRGWMKMGLKSTISSFVIRRIAHCFAFPEYLHPRSGMCCLSGSHSTATLKTQTEFTQ